MCFPGGSGFLILANRALKKIFAVHDFAFRKARFIYLTPSL